MREVLQRWSTLELIQYRGTGRRGAETGGLNSVHAYDQAGSGECSLYGRSHTQVFNNVLGFIAPAVSAVEPTYATAQTRSRTSALRSTSTSGLTSSTSTCGSTGRIAAVPSVARRAISSSTSTATSPSTATCSPPASRSTTNSAWRFALA